MRPVTIDGYSITAEKKQIRAGLIQYAQHRMTDYDLFVCVLYVQNFQSDRLD